MALPELFVYSGIHQLRTQIVPARICKQVRVWAERLLMSKTVAAATISTPVRFYEWRSLNCSCTQAYTHLPRKNLMTPASFGRGWNHSLDERFFNGKKKEDFKEMAKTVPYTEGVCSEPEKLSADERKRLEYEAREKAVRDYNSLMGSQLRPLKTADRPGYYPALIRFQ